MPIFVECHESLRDHDMLKKYAKQNKKLYFMALIIKTAELSIKTALQSVQTAELMFIPPYKVLKPRN